jgi:hypothetical protein
MLIESLSVEFKAVVAIITAYVEVVQVYRSELGLLFLG